MHGKSIEYTALGPKIVDVVVEEPARTKGRKNLRGVRRGGATVGSMVEPAGGRNSGNGRQSRVVRLATKQKDLEENEEDEGEESDVVSVTREASSELE